MKKVYIAYGFNEGPLHAAKMKRALKKYGYTVTNFQKEADLCITHSGGHVLLNKTVPTQRVLAIDPAIPAGRSAILNIFDHLGYDFRHLFLSRHWRFYLQKTLYNLLYALVRFRHNIRVARGYLANKNIDILMRPSTIVTESDDQSWQSREFLRRKKPHTFHASHDDCWLHPERYLDIL